MFSGIVEEMGTVHRIERTENLAVVEVRARKVWKGTKPGDSVAVDGVCLTVTGVSKDVLAFDLMRETLEKTTLGRLRLNEKVNLERALKVGGRLSGHFVTGHVDEVGRILRVIAQKDYTQWHISFSAKLARSIAPKGSVCLDGVSLTVGEVKKGYFSVHLIPFTKRVTTLGVKKKGGKLNIEVDILARYITIPL